MFNRMAFSNEEKKPAQTFTDLKKMPPSHRMLHSQQNGSTFTRQDSLAIASSLQERDRECHMIDFMETELDLDNYLACFNELDVQPDTVDFDDNELQKANILYDEGLPQDYAQPLFEDYNDGNMGFQNDGDPFILDGQGPISPLMTPKGDLIEDEDRYQMQCESKPQMYDQPSQVKKSGRPTRRNTQITNDEWDNSCSDSSSNDPRAKIPAKRLRRNNDTMFKYKPQTTARKYQLKPETEKAEPVYKLKRARNNDAVRKSRNKAKEAQRKKDEEHEKMKKRIAELESLLEAERKARQRDREMIEQLLSRK